MAFSAHDVVPDSPTNTFATLNPLELNSGTITNGNIDFSTGASYKYGKGTIYIPSSGKWVFEVYFKTNATTNNYNSCGVATLLFSTTGAAPSSGYYGINDASTNFGQTFIENGTRYGSITLPAGTVIQLIIDRDAGELKFSKNGTLQTGTGSTVTLPSSTVALIPVVGEYNISATVNFGQDHTFGGYPNSLASSSGYSDSAGYGSFYYDPTQIASGVKALCTANLPDPDIDPNADDLPEDYFEAVTYAGNSTNNRNITNLAFNPDFVWIKDRSVSNGHRIFDSVRGVNKNLVSNDTSSETTNNIYGYLSSFNTNGFTLSAGSDPTNPYDAVNKTGDDYVAWCWKAGGAPSADDKGVVDGVERTITGDSKLDAGTITPTRMSVNTKAGFSIISATVPTGTGNTLPHGLTQKPDFIILKSTNLSTHWEVYHKDLAIDGERKLYLDDTGDQIDSAFMNDTPPTTNVFSFNVGSNQSNHIAYCWHSVPGYSAFGSYTGNSSTDGPFIYTGFKPAWVMIKKTNGAASWWIVDAVRDEYNPTKKYLLADTSGQESNGSDYITADFLSNGFKIRNTSVSFNSGTHIYAAFAEQPFKYANAR